MAATKTAASTQTVSGYSTEERIPATRYKQGERTVFGLHLTPGEIVNMIHRPNPDTSNPGNRKIRPKHAADFADYYLQQPRWVAPGIILRAPSIFTFAADIGIGDGDSQVGTLAFERRNQAEIQILDGQHRILGFHLALEKIATTIDKAKDFRARALRAEGGDKGAPAVREAEKMLRDAEALRDRFYNERVSVEIQVTDDLTEYRQMFYDIAENQLGITAAVKSRFDSSKVANRALAVVLDHKLFDGRVDIEQDRIGKNSPYLLSAKHVADIIRSVTVGVDGRIGKIMERTLNDHTLATNTSNFLDITVESFAQYQALLAGQVMPETLRETGLLGSPATLRMLASLYHELRSDKHAWDDDMVKAYFKALEPHLNDYAHANSIWIKRMPEDAFPLGGHGPDVRRQNIAAAVDALVDWAILGKKGAPWVWQKPKAAPKPEPTEDEAQLALDIAADPELGELLKQREEAEAKMAKAGKVKS